MPRRKKQQFKVGDTAKVTRCLIGDSSHEGRIGKLVNIHEDGTPYIDVRGDGKVGTACHAIVAEKIIKALDDLEVGDVVTDKYGSERTVLGVCGKVLCLSCYGDQDSYEVSCTAKTLQELGYTVKGQHQETETITMTVEEIEKKLGITNLHVVGAGEEDDD